MHKSHHAAYYDGILDYTGALEQSLESPESSLSRPGLLETFKEGTSSCNTFMTTTNRRMLTKDAKSFGNLIAIKWKETLHLQAHGPGTEYKAEQERVRNICEGRLTA